ncbi:MAG: hypothetical protein ACFN4V_05525 [Prevotella denticola]
MSERPMRQRDAECTAAKLGKALPEIISIADGASFREEKCFSPWKESEAGR